MIPLINVLADSFEIYCTSWGEGLSLLKRNGLECVEVPPVDVQWGSEGRMAFKRTVRSLPQFYGSFGVQIIREIELIRRRKPNLVISDSRLSAVVAAYTSGVPRLLITNQMRVNLPPLKSRMMRILERINGESLAAFWNAADATIVPDLPPPYTISEDSLQTLRLPRNRYRYVGFFGNHTHNLTSDPDHLFESQFKDDSVRKKVFFMISGPTASRKSLIPKVARAARLLSQEFRVILSKGDPTASSEPKKDGEVMVYDWCPDHEVQSLMRSCDLIVSRAGHETISKVIFAGKPAVLIPIPFHGEQWGNAQKCERLGFARSIDQQSLTAESLASEVRSCIQDCSMLKSVQRIKEVAMQLDGINNAAMIVKWFGGMAQRRNGS
jgi:UDP:flavonoid glycosyltransferase YjiC (YdhE family)